MRGIFVAKTDHFARVLPPPTTTTHTHKQTNTHTPLPHNHSAASTELVKDSVGRDVIGTPAYTYTLTNLALGHMWFPWVARGVFVGQRRSFLSVHIDDWHGSLSLPLALFVSVCVRVRVCVCLCAARSVHPPACARTQTMIRRRESAGETTNTSNMHYAPTCARKHTQTHTHTRTYTHTHTHTRTHVHTHAKKAHKGHANTHTIVHTYTHLRTQVPHNGAAECCQPARGQLPRGRLRL